MHEPWRPYVLINDTAPCGADPKTLKIPNIPKFYLLVPNLNKVKFFVMSEQGQSGPYDLSQLTEIGLRPSSYVWTKGMADWLRADEVPEICYLFRQHLVGGAICNSPVEKDTILNPKSDDGAINNLPQDEDARRFVRSFTADDDPPENIDLNTPPLNLLPIAILTAILCFPLSGVVAIYYSYRIRKLWRDSDREDITDAERNELRLKSYDSLRLAKMWIGYTISLGLIFSAITIFKGLI
ncbi:MAG: GYF domain-containing protein [Clostridium sp.]|nr:GYF domain-containing protein [Prevotella sp.]MCM1428903.1 GYF domain-containing protein [Clostridium sp.]MCM1475282.1 GYF domain-containing protein [Muribaculaceae bacterium]